MKCEMELLIAFNDRGVRYGNELIVLKEFCGDFVYACRLARLGVVGIDGYFLLEDGNIKPNLDEIADFSDIEDYNFDGYIGSSANAASRFISDMLKNGKSNGYCFTLTDSLSNLTSKE